MKNEEQKHIIVSEKTKQELENLKVIPREPMEEVIKRLLNKKWN